MQFINTFADGILPQCDRNATTKTLFIPVVNCKDHENLRALLNLIFASCTHINKLVIKDWSNKISSSLLEPFYPEYKSKLNLLLMKNRLQELKIQRVTAGEHFETFHALLQ
ncbi:hypothetical protein FGO68_gene13322 [Halteria grandinella]|uniref:Uncharacterized protein n=1 Tax=Halteria grandinella TaxID=5974 RepID=A0A8J8NW47_HALGN|nr:hypothetical protein FGO68_gene13322 [Halteria grandinella]